LKLSELKSIKPYVNLPTRFGLAGLILAALILATVVGVSLVSFSGASARKVYAAPLSFHDELQLQLGSDGFTPAEVQRAAGTFAIAVVNSAIAGEYTLQLKTQDGTVLKRSAGAARFSGMDRYVVGR
jgi:hypothetical protein